MADTELTGGSDPLTLGPIDGNCLEAWSPPETVENAHDLGNRDIYKAPLNNNLTDKLSPAPEANR